MNTAAVRVRSDVLSREVVNNRLVITDRSYTAYVSVFPYGTSLYVGWMMWRNRRGATLIAIYIKDVIGSIFGRTGLVNQMLRTEKVRAMREAIHSAVREGVDVAVQDIDVPMMSTFGRDVAVQDMIGAGAVVPSPVPAGWLTPGWPSPRSPQTPSTEPVPAVPPPASTPPPPRPQGQGPAEG